MKVKLEGVQETLLIPLIAKSNESKLPNGRFKDKDAEDMVEKIDYDFSKFEQTMSLLGVIARTVVLDREIQKYINKDPDATYICIGCGLDTRYQRLNHGNIKWINLDFPEVITLRKKLLQEGEHVQYISKSALDPSWTEEIPKDCQHALVILEGILMYFTQEEVERLLGMLHKRFKKCTVFAEIMHPFIAKQSKNHDTVSKTDAVFHWGVKSGKAMEPMCSGMICKNEWNITDELMDNLTGIMRLVAKIPFIRNKNDKIVQLEINN